LQEEHSFFSSFSNIPNPIGPLKIHMKMYSAILAFLVVSVVMPLQAEDAAKLPVYPRSFAGGPEFQTKEGKQSAGTASVVTAGPGLTQGYVVSARHLLGPMGGFKEQIPAVSVPAFVRAIKIESFSSGSRTYQVSGLLVPATDADPFKNRKPIDDLAIYRVKGDIPAGQAGELAAELPKVGDMVWVLAHVQGGVPEGQILHSAKVVFSKDGDWLTAQFDNDHIITSGASGAPVLDATGKVVGVYSGHSTKNGHVIAYIIPSTMILPLIKQPETGTH
jgi:hypothetical protein